MGKCSDVNFKRLRRVIVITRTRYIYLYIAPTFRIYIKVQIKIAHESHATAPGAARRGGGSRRGAGVVLPNATVLHCVGSRETLDPHGTRAVLSSCILKNENCAKAALAARHLHRVNNT